MTPNRFELGLLAGSEPRSMGALVEAARGWAARTAVTGCALADTPAASVETVAIDGGRAWRVATPRLPVRPAGTGDLFTGLLAAGLAAGAGFPEAVARAVSSTYAVLESTAAAGAYEMRLAPSVAALTRPKRLFQPVASAPEAAEGCARP